jgi:hypothetical protein
VFGVNVAQSVSDYRRTTVSWTCHSAGGCRPIENRADVKPHKLIPTAVAANAVNGTEVLDWDALIWDALITAIVRSIIALPITNGFIIVYSSINGLRSVWILLTHSHIGAFEPRPLHERYSRLAATTGTKPWMTHSSVSTNRSVSRLWISVQTPCHPVATTPYRSRESRSRRLDVRTVSAP